MLHTYRLTNHRREAAFDALLNSGSNKHVKNKKSICVFASQPQPPKLTIANHTRKCHRI